MLDRFDVLAGASGRSIQTCEAMWRDGGPPGVSWAQAYMVAKHRARDVGADNHEGRTVAFLEGMLAAYAIVADQYSLIPRNLREGVSVATPDA